MGRPEQQAAEPWTVQRVLQWVADDLRARGIETPKLEAELLLAHALGCTRIQLIIDRDRVLIPEELAVYRAFVSRRRKHEPVAYLRGEKEFYGLVFRVDRRVLVPRPDTETLVEVALRRTRMAAMHGRMLDLCTGSGAVAIAFAKERPTWSVLATDISSDALDVARQNAVRLGVIWNADFLLGDLFAPVSGEPFDLITSNPPYIASGDMPGLPPDVRDHEPRLALDGGADGLDVVRRIVGEAGAHLASGGVVALEIGADQSEQVTELMSAAGLVEVSVDRDLGGRPRVVSGKKV